MKKELLIRVMPAIYLSHQLILRSESPPVYDLSKREVYLSNTTDLNTVLFLLKELMLSKKPSFLFCLNWGEESYYFEKDGSISKFSEAPSTLNV